MSEENKALVRYFYEAYSTGNVAALDDIVAPNFVNHNPLPNDAPGLEGLKERLRSASAQLNNRFTIEDMLADGDKVAVRYTMTGTQQTELMGNPATVGKSSRFRG